MTDILKDIKDESIFNDRIVKIKTHNDNNCLTGDPAIEPTLELFKVQWQMSHVLLSEINKLSMLRFRKRMISVRDHRSLSNESIKNGTVDVRLDFECKENVPANTTVYCFIIHDRDFNNNYFNTILGIYFSLLQLIEYINAPFTITDSIYGSTFFIATFHEIHVIIGTLFLSICLIRLYKIHFSSYHHFGFETAS
ncbi:Cytochrome c oxidase subunit 3 [Atta colombica]|uniref:Cytochrome c oxidase subunit 3 n=1 Tax=Atta colombica TaxID=520822 RepID=A0A151HZ15_9HYME|nr:Cytochrome c oxidase subunit 3 [Atta colombica]